MMLQKTFSNSQTATDLASSRRRSPPCIGVRVTISEGGSSAARHTTLTSRDPRHTGGPRRRLDSPYRMGTSAEACADGREARNGMNSVLQESLAAGSTYLTGRDSPPRIQNSACRRIDDENRIIVQDRDVDSSLGDRQAADVDRPAPLPAAVVVEVITGGDLREDLALRVRKKIATSCLPLLFTSIGDPRFPPQPPNPSGVGYAGCPLRLWGNAHQISPRWSTRQGRKRRRKVYQA